MMWLFLNAALAGPLLDASLGLIGREERLIPVAQNAYESAANSDWSSCATQFKHRADLKDSHRHSALIWSLVCNIRAEDYSTAFDVLGELVADAEEVGWRLLIVESWLLQELGGNREAIKLLQDYPMEESDTIGARMIELRSYQSSGRRRRADKLKRSMIVSGKSDAWFWYEMSRSAPTEQRTAFLERAIHAPRASITHFYSLFLHHESDDRTDLILRYGLEGLTVFPESSQLSEYMFNFTSSEDGRALLVQKVTDLPEHPAAQGLLGLLLLSESQPEQSRVHLNQAIKFGQGTIPIFQALYDANVLCNDDYKAWAVLKIAVQEHPSVVHFWKDFSRLSLTSEQKVDYLFVFDSMEPTLDETHIGLLPGVIDHARDLGDFERALNWSEQEVSLHPNSWTALSRKALVLSELDRSKDSIDSYEHALSLSLANSYILNNLAWQIVHFSGSDHSDLERALALIQSAISSTTTEVAGYYDTLAASFWALDYREEALEAQRKAINLNGNDQGYQFRYRQYEGVAQ